LLPHADKKRRRSGSPSPSMAAEGAGVETRVRGARNLGAGEAVGVAAVLSGREVIGVSNSVKEARIAPPKGNRVSSRCRGT
jgi:hypothetical protein